MGNNQELKKQVDFLYSAVAKLLYNLALYASGNQIVAEQITLDAFSDSFHSIPDKSDVNLLKFPAVVKDLVNPFESTRVPAPTEHPGERPSTLPVEMPAPLPVAPVALPADRPAAPPAEIPAPLPVNRPAAQTWGGSSFPHSSPAVKTRSSDRPSQHNSAPA